jgi:GDP-D-mannose dehydratase
MTFVTRKITATAPGEAREFVLGSVDARRNWG